MLESVNLCIKHMLSCGEGPKRSADTKMHLYYSPKISVLLTCRTTWDSPSLKLASLSIPLTWKMASAYNFKFSCHSIRTRTDIYTKLPSLQHIETWTKPLNPISIGQHEFVARFGHWYIPCRILGNGRCSPVPILFQPPNSIWFEEVKR